MAMTAWGTNIIVGCSSAPLSFVYDWNGSSWTALGSGMGGTGAIIYALTGAGSNLYAGGSFINADGATAFRIAQWSGNGWSAVGAGMNDTVYTLTASGANVYAGGNFTDIGGTSITHIALWSGSEWSAMGSGASNIVYALTTSGQNMYLGGDFVTAGGNVSPYVTEVRINSVADSLTSSFGTTTVGFSGVVGYQYDVLRTTNLLPPVTWTPVNTNPISPAVDGSFSFMDTSPPSGTAYYRAVQR